MIYNAIANPIIFENHNFVDFLPSSTILCVTRRSYDLSVSKWPRLKNFKNIIIRESGYPTEQEIEYLCNRYCDLFSSATEVILGIGGGSTLDAAKAFSTRLIQKSRERTDLRLILVPTNLGSGAEITPYATLWDFDSSRKTSLELYRGIKQSLFLEDSFLTSLNLEDLNIGILDAICHAYDSYTSRNTNPFFRELARSCFNELVKDLGLLTKFQLRTGEQICKIRARTLIAGLCIAQTKTSLSHGLSYGLTLVDKIPHGYAVALVLNSWLKYNSYEDSATDLLTDQFQSYMDSSSYISNLRTGLSREMLQYRKGVDSKRLKNSIFVLEENDIQNILSGV